VAHRIFRLSAILIIAIPAVAGATTLGAFSFVGSAGAATLIRCTHVTGNFTGMTTITLRGCSGNTGGASKPITPALTFLSAGGTITWVNGKKTTVTMASTGNETDTDPAGGSCPAGSSEIESKGKVTADNTRSAPVGGVARGEVCENLSTTALTLEPLSAFTFK
jgi:hypothetical protein